LFLFGGLTAQNPPPRTIHLDQQSTLADYLTYAALNSPELKSAFYKWQAAMEKIGPARSLPNPQFSFAYYIRHVETRVGPQQNRWGIMQMFPWFGKLKYKGKAASAAAQAAKKMYENQRQRTFSAVKKQLYITFFLGKQISIIGENLQWLHSIEKLISIRYSTGKVSHGNLVKVQLELDRLKDRLESLNDHLSNSRIALKSILNFPLDKTMPVPRILPYPSPSLDLKKLNHDLLEKNLQLKSLQQLIVKADYGIRLAKSNYFPDFSLGFNTITTGPGINPDMPGSGKDPIIAMATIHIPIWFGKNNANLRGAKANHRAAVYRKQAKTNQLLAQMHKIYYRYKDALRKINLYENHLIPKARQVLAVTQTAFTAGKSDVLTLIDSHRMLLSLQIGYEKYRASSGQALADLEWIIGDNLGGYYE
jgi:outer membrane protein TolC